ncbi:MAG: acetyl-CoA carboxylase carboxyltransferase subunit beta [Alphaproteobacteria bacterium]|nr:acetyl-CoA carboxylase carboxyltransferase subunit beta [Alphaproteobacteria bacterium]
MSWLTNFVRPKLRALVGKDVPDNLWHKCPKCEQMLFHRDLAENLHVCHHCGHHMRLSAKRRLELLFDEGNYQRIPLTPAPQDPLKFKDLKKYSDRLKDAKAATHEEDAVVVAEGTIQGYPIVIAAFDFHFMGGSMGAAVGNAIVDGARAAVKSKAAFMVISASGGARMQEGILSLMQMSRTTVGVCMVKEAGLPYLTLLSDPTAGGVTASFAMLGDIALAEPGATICFAGRRVIEQTIRHKLPDDFQTAEHLQEHGMVDMVVKRADLPKTIGTLLRHLMSRHH